MPNLIQDILRRPTLRRIRRNHGLEHATIHILSGRYPQTTLIGRSDHKGFFLYGEVPSESVEEAAEEALVRLRSGDWRLALHPNCGTNLVTAGLLAGTASFFSLLGNRNDGWRQRLERLPLALASTMLALVVAQPLGRAAQQHITTESDPGPLKVTGIKRLNEGFSTVHRVLTQD